MNDRRLRMDFIIKNEQELKMKKIVLTGGGSSGHVTPNIALLPKLKELGYEIHYIGSRNGMERQLVEGENIPYHPINAGKLRRYLDVKNITDVFRVMDGFRQALLTIRKWKPEVVFSKGGFVACPVVWAAWVCRVPVVIHESDMTPGLTNRLSIPFAAKVCYTFPETKAHIPEGKGVLTGIPIREALLSGIRGEGLRICGFSHEKPVIMVMGGSQGAESVNKVVRSSLQSLLKDFQVCHICGKGNIDPEFNRIKGYKQFEYVNEEQPHIFAMADLVVSRAGATSLFELLALRKPNLLIPLSRKASRGDQILNAKSFERQGFSIVLEEEHLDSSSLIASVQAVHKRREEFADAMKKSAVGSGVQGVLAILEGCRQR
jgi:UDP-N-acetylglucosamine--N-acetylmuramyl-(pentapeptide) pyrophosphoryl-undecaprenol N-acetylglucosamine transferase